MKRDSDYQKLKEEFDQFVYIISHDFNGPIRAINNLSDWISEDLEGIEIPEVKTNLSLLKSRAIRLQKMLDGAKRISRIARFDISASSFNTRDVLTDIVNQNNEKLDVEFIGEFPKMESYQKKFESVVEALILNAIQFKKEAKAKLVITGKIVKDSFEIIILDKGFGIPSNALDKVFNLYYTAEAKDKTEGIGIGLYYVQKVMDFVGGKVAIKSEENKYTEVKVTWPINLKNNERA